MRRQTIKTLANYTGQNEALNFVSRAFREAKPEAVLELTVEEVKEKKSKRQAGYYWAGIVRPLWKAAQEAGNTTLTPEEMHQILKRQCNPQWATMPNGARILSGGSTKDLTREQAGVFIERCHAFAVEYFGIILRAPSAMEWDNFHNMFK